jgi:hypothetical protein
MTPVDFCDSEIIAALRQMHRLVPVHVSADEVAERIGAPTKSVIPRLKRLAQAGHVTQVPGFCPGRYVP